MRWPWLLGREHSGLTNEELASYHFLAHTPTNLAFHSLNVASAAQIFAYELRRTWRTAEGQRRGQHAEEVEREPAPAETMEGFLRTWRRP